MSVLLTLLLVVMLFCIMMGTFACDKVWSLGRQVRELDDMVRALQAERKPVVVPKQPRRVS